MCPELDGWRMVPRLVSECREIFRMGHPRRAGGGILDFTPFEFAKQF